MNDSKFLMEMEYCAEHGIPHSVLLGRAVGPDEPMWLELDHDKLVAFLSYRGELCPRCGTRNSDWVDERSRFLESPKWEWHSHRCFGCQERSLLQKSMPSGDESLQIVRLPHSR